MGIDPNSFPDRFEDRVERYKRRWNNEMGEHLADPPRFDNVVRIVRRHLRGAELLDRKDIVTSEDRLGVGYGAQLQAVIRLH